MAAYYKKIKGKKYDGKLLRIADSSVKGKGDGRISLKDAKKILGTVKDSNDYSVVEKNTMRYIRDSYSFTPEADRWFRSEIRKWAASKGVAKPASKKSVKKAAKKTPKKKIVKKAAKKSAKKSVKKVVKKAAKKGTAKKVKKAAPKSRAVKKAPRVAPRPSISREPSPPRSREDYEYEERMQPVKYSSGPAAKKKKSSYGYWILGILIAALVIGLYVSPQCGKQIKETIRCGEAKKATTGETIEPPKTTPVTQEEAVVPEEPKSPEPEKATREIEGAYYHTVEPKDDLISISRKLLNDWSKWRDIYEANRDIITTPYVIHPGQRLRIPGLEGNE
ncbi:MAG: LysM peptidoglycan-binding domain-containing protein [Spirochaetes bacterium]|nr:LysM peptidoglycan-binding domain-containing protein [Spirochaetota bacterium]